MKRIKFIDDVDLEIGFENDYEIIFGDIFYFCYQGINVFFYVCKTTTTQVCLYELAKKKIKYEGKTVNILCPGLKPTKSPNIITHNNCCCKSQFWVNVADKNHIIIPIESDMPIYHKVDFPCLGYFEATKIPDEEKSNGVLNYYWEIY